MFHLMEPLFDLAYLGLVVALGLRLLLEESPSARRYGFMAVLLGAGDAFHLVPRVLAHLSSQGFERYLPLLSWGEFVTSLSMTFFYLLFYAYYRERSGDSSSWKKTLVLILVALRVILVLLPQNGWGTEGSYTFSLLRNVPFALLGFFLILWAWQKREVEGLRYTGLLIFLSFLFYLPVVIGARFVPLLGVLMIPKTVAYVLLVLVGYRYFIRSFTALSFLKTSFVFLILGLSGGVFYREVTRAFHYTAYTSLSVLHVHLLVLGALFSLILFALLKEQTGELGSLKRPFTLTLSGLALTVVCMTVRGLCQITVTETLPFPDGALSGIAGIGHILLGIGLVLCWLAALRRESLQQKAVS